MTQANNADQLLDITVRQLTTDPVHLQPMANSFIDQWVRALGSGHLVLDDISDELEQLKAALAAGKNLQIAESLHSLAKLTRKSLDGAADGVKDKLQELADTLDTLSTSLGRKGK
ncbi:hypothetical protein [Larkinella arboricola]|uniref:Uncharacterized protein n=1 Tax=Larkinella arboricola TaxID=643671 RepID=A0A327X0M7_LARAB|nr:hypothetical protein [Larkinella arboricola]RAJ99781.1 hypothetical protein LX87_01477 [Larkinella arboricola]